MTPAEYDEAIKQADIVYRKRMHNIFCDNCHSHVARVLNNLKYKGRTNYTMIDVWWMCSTRSSYVSWCHILITYCIWILVGAIYGGISINKALSWVWKLSHAQNISHSIQTKNKKKSCFIFCYKKSFFFFKDKCTRQQQKIIFYAL